MARAVEREVRLRGRGRRRLSPARLTVRDPLGLARREVVSDGETEVLVLPRIDPVLVARRGGAGGGLAGVEEGPASGALDARALELEVDGLREHREGAPASRIHWPTVARTGQLIERRLVSGAETMPLVVLDASRPSSPGALDAAVRAAGSLCRHLSRAGGCALLLPGERRPLSVDSQKRGWAQAHARLALVGATRTPPSVAGAQRAGAVFWVTANESARLPTPLRTGGARYLVGPGVRGPGSPAFLVSGCEGRRVGARAARPVEAAA